MRSEDIQREMDLLNKRTGIWARKEWSECRQRHIYVISNGNRARSFISVMWGSALRAYQFDAKDMTLWN